MQSSFKRISKRPLPVLILADVSGSMGYAGKIDALNQAVRDMIRAFATGEDLNARIHVGVITFGGEAGLHIPLQPADRVEWTDMYASGMTPLGAALKIAKRIIEDREQVPSKAYRPTVVLVSDGMPNDEWREPMHEFIHTGRSSKVDRMALAIGPDADINMLKEFLNDPEKQVFYAKDASQILKFFNFVTMSISMRSRSVNPNSIPKLPMPGQDKGNDDIIDVEDF